AVFCFEELDYLVRLSRRHDILFADVPTYKLRYHHGQISPPARSDGRAVWLRKQRVLLRVMKRHILADPAYYERHRTRLDRRLADLHRAVAVPMLLAHAGTPAGDRNARNARLYLRRCRQYGHPERTLMALTIVPSRMRAFALQVTEGLRQAGVGGFGARAFDAVRRSLGFASRVRNAPGA